MVIEYARNMAGLVDANSMEFDNTTPHPVIATMNDQRDVVAGERDMGGTMRLGLYPAKLLEGSVVRETYGEPYVEERHRHRFEVNNDYRDSLGDRLAWSSVERRQMDDSSSTSNFLARCIRITWQRRRTRSSAHVRRGRIRCSKGLIAAAVARKPEQVALPEMERRVIDCLRHRWLAREFCRRTRLADKRGPRKVRRARGSATRVAKWRLVTDRVELDGRRCRRAGHRGSPRCRGHRRAR